MRISNGTPRWTLPYGLRHVAKLVVPHPSLVFDRSITDAKFSRHYVAGLERIGKSRIATELAEIGRRAGPHDLALLCFERDPSRCHRSAFARWWCENTGEMVEEWSYADS